ASVVQARECDLNKFSPGNIIGDRSDYEACVQAGHKDRVDGVILRVALDIYENTQYCGGLNNPDNLLKVINNPNTWRDSKLVNYQPIRQMRLYSELADLSSVKGEIEESNVYLRSAMNAYVRAFDFPKPVITEFYRLLSTDHTLDEYKQFIESLDMNVVDLIRLRDGFVQYQGFLNRIGSSSYLKVEKIEAAIAILNQKIAAIQAQTALENVVPQEQNQENK
ncbi:hypothetical protein EBQ93_04580, partial [bacterium]|nr:hypothetical protein [bacterium]